MVSIVGLEAASSWQHSIQISCLSGVRWLMSGIEGGALKSAAVYEPSHGVYGPSHGVYGPTCRTS